MKRSGSQIILSLAFSLLFVTIFSTSTSILGNIPSYDSSIFQIIGKGWTEGILPYSGLWDQKGPLIFFINAVGFWLLKSNLGIFIIQVISLAVATYYTISFFRHYFSDAKSFTYTLATLAFLSICTEGGNSVEEYLLPLLMPAFFYMYEWTQQWCNNQDISHSYLYAFLYGIILAFSFLTRLTNAMGICIGALIIAIVLLQHSKWKNLLMNSLFFLLGLMVLTIPFIGYFYSKGALDEMLYGTIFYNVGYAKHSFANFGSFFSIVSFLLGYASCIFLVIVSIITIIFNSQRRRSGYFWLMISGLTLLFFFSSFKFNHYAIITLPYLCIGIVEMKYNLPCIRNHSLKKIIRYGVGCLIFSVSLWSFHEIYQVINDYTDRKIMAKEYQKIAKEIPHQARNSFVAYNMNPSCYLYLGITPACRFFFPQDRLIRNNPDIKTKIVETFRNCHVNWILVDTKIWDGDVRKALSARYSIYNQYGYYTLLRLNE